MAADRETYKPGPFVRRMRAAVETLAMLVMAAVMVHTFCVSGWLAPIIVSSGSMAPAFLGPHISAECPDCGMPLVCDEADWPNRETLACPNCGRQQIPIGEAARAGDRLLINRAVAGSLSPWRWQPALFFCPDRPGEYCLKRVVGLPGESIEIRGGDVFVDGAITRKTLAQQRAMAILVNDSEWKSSDAELPCRWISNSSDWQRSTDGWQCSGAGQHWLRFNSGQRQAGPDRSIAPAPLRDQDSYNQADSRRLNDVTDLILVAQLMSQAKGQLLLEAHDGHETFLATIAWSTGEVELKRAGQIVATARSVPLPVDRSIEIVLSLVDRQVIVAVNGATILGYSYEPLIGPIVASPQPLAIGANAMPAKISRLQIWRDVYYTAPVGNATHDRRILAADEYFVLGDNSPVSRDSREWPDGAVRAALFVGRPLAVFRRAPWSRGSVFRSEGANQCCRQTD